MRNRLRHEYAPASEREEDWRHSAACLKEDPELFFPIGSTSRADKQQIDEAKKVCRGCSVSKQCLKLAFENDERFGIWGGLTDDERRSLKRMNHRQRLLAQDAIQAANGKG